MRTTLTIDDDIANKLKSLSARQHKSFKEVVNTALRRGLASPASQEQSVSRRIKLRSSNLPYCKGVDELKLKERMDELESSEFVDS